MPIMQAVLNTPGAGESVEFGDGSSAEIAIGGAESGGEYAVVRYRVTTPVKLVQRFLAALGRGDILALFWGHGPRRAKNRERL